jgi:hypothetical protein
MGASEFVTAVDAIQAALKPVLKAHGYKVRGRTFNRVTEDGLTQVINVQLGPPDLPGTVYIPGLTRNLHGLFTLNLGVYVPEVAAWTSSGPPRAWVQEYYCCIRDRLGHVSGAQTDAWWHAYASQEVIDDIRMRLAVFGLPFLARFATRDLILAELHGKGENLAHCSVPRIVSAIILAERRETTAARALLALQTGETRNPGHPAYVRALAERMGLGDLS